MEFVEALKKRHSIREYSDHDVSDEEIERVLEAARSAPSAGGLKAYEMFVVRSEEDRKKLFRACSNQEQVEQAPVDIIFAANPEASAVKYGERGRELYCIQDATLAASFAWLRAVDLGLAGSWVGYFDEDEVREVVRIPSNLRPVAILTVGHAKNR